MKYCTAKDAKLRLQCLCELCALCGETVNSNLQSAFICIHLRLISAEIQPNSFLLSPASRHFNSPALPLLTQPPLPLYLIPCAQMLCVLAAASVVGGCCRWQPLLLKYKIYEILHRKVRKKRKVTVIMSLRTLRSLR